MIPRAECNLAHLMVADTGVGMLKELMEHVFEPYSRVESGATRHIRGTGLGLTIARQLIKLHGGRVWADGVEGNGSTFYCVIPVGTIVARDLARRVINVPAA